MIVKRFTSGVYAPGDDVKYMGVLQKDFKNGMSSYGGYIEQYGGKEKTLMEGIDYHGTPNYLNPEDESSSQLSNNAYGGTRAVNYSRGGHRGGYNPNRWQGGQGGQGEQGGPPNRGRGGYHNNSRGYHHQNSGNYDPNYSNQGQGGYNAPPRYNNNAPNLSQQDYDQSGKFDPHGENSNFGPSAQAAGPSGNGGWNAAGPDRPERKQQAPGGLFM